MKTRIVFTVLVVLVLIIFGSAWEYYKGPIEAEIAVQQLNDNATDYAVSRAVAEGKIEKVVYGVGGVILLFIWVPVALRKFRS